MKTRNEPYPEVRMFPKIDKIKILKNNDYKVPVNIRASLSRMCPIISFIYTDVDTNLIRAIVKDPSWLDEYRPMRHTKNPKSVGYQTNCAWSNYRPPSCR